MEGLRGFAVFSIFLVHYMTLVEPWITSHPVLLKFADAVHSMGTTGVDLFFVLSGYLIYGSLIARPQRFLRFMGRRVARIYPAFLVVFAVYVALSFVFPAESKIPEAPGEAAIYLVQNLLLLPGLFPFEPMITVAWSLSYEMFYYIAIPVLIALLGLKYRNRAWRVIFFLLVGISIAGYCAIFDGPVRLNLFLSGVLLYEALGFGRWGASSRVGMGGLSVGMLSMLLPVQGPSGFALKVSIIAVAFFALCLACFREPGSAWLPRAFSVTPLRWLGNMSYSYYLLHGLALKAGFLALGAFIPASSTPGPWLFWLMLPSMFALTLLPTAALFLMIEHPFSLAKRAGKNVADPSQASVQAPATTE